MPVSAPGHCALARANHVFGTDEKRIRTKNMVMDRGNGGLGINTTPVQEGTYDDPSPA
jgi:hypothetical protein